MDDNHWSAPKGGALVMELGSAGHQLRQLAES